jgi:acyl-CoA reductase-like NAD-dependent aldehyde dehydrogenase
VLPRGIVNVVSGSGSVAGERLVVHPDVPRIAFTGSVEVGRRIQRQGATECVKVITLELGGKNPIIVFPDADEDDAIMGVVRGMNFTWQGQSCGSTSRLYVHRSIFARFIERLVGLLEELKVGDPTQEDTDVGAIVSKEQYDSVVHYLELGLSHPRARLLTGGPTENSGGGWFVRPTLFALEGGDEGITIAEEEIFGPILVAMPFDSYSEVIKSANRLRLGLTASVWTSSIDTAMSAVRDLETGYAWVNSSSAHIPGAPFGGTKDSGVGREESIEELYSFTQSKNVYVRFRTGEAKLEEL